MWSLGFGALSPAKSTVNDLWPPQAPVLESAIALRQLSLYLLVRAMNANTAAITSDRLWLSVVFAFRVSQRGQLRSVHRAAPAQRCLHKLMLTAFMSMYFLPELQLH